MFAKAFRLFVSSTFQDFGEERRLLQDEVFAKLTAHCAEHGFGFRAVDMRWGVNDDAQLNQRTAEICLGEVIEAKGYPAPNLLILIGNRYGWVPLPFAIARDEFEALREWLVVRGNSEAVADLDRVYALDENHWVPGGLTMAGADLVGAYTLRSREDELVDLKTPEAWAPVEARLRDALQAAARHLHANGQLRDAEYEKYTVSLTEQEIRKGLEQLAASDGPAAANSIAWVRTANTAEPPVQALADVVQQALPEENVLRAGRQAECAGYGEHFVEQITARLIAALDVQIAEFKARAKAPDFALQTERAIHAAFAVERLRVFVGRDSNLAAIAAHIASDARHPLVLTGISGSGKTALMARAAAETNGKVVHRFVGASASSANQRNLLISVVEELAALGVASLPAHWEDDDNPFVHQVRDLLAALDQPVAIFIDAVDQLRAPYRSMWLPPQLHPQVKLIVSVLDDKAFTTERGIVQGLRRSLPAEAFLAIEPLSEKDGADILEGLQRDAQRGLTPDQQTFILERFQAAGASPLWLRIAFAIARRWRSTDDPRAHGLAEEVTALIGQFLDELSTVHHHEPLLVRRALGLIAAGREGLSESEAIAVLSRDTDVMAAVSSERFGAKTDRLPDAVWVRLKRSLGALLVEKGEEGEPLVTFFHRQLADVVRARFYEPEKAALHTALAAHFDAPAKLPDADPAWTRRCFIELPFQLFKAGKRERLDSLLTDPAWIDLKIATLQGVGDIVADYASYANPIDSLRPLIGRALRLAAGHIGRDGRQRIPQLHGRLLGAGSPAFLSGLKARMPLGTLFEALPALTPPGAELARLEGHSDEVLALAILPDGCLASGSEDNTIRLWDAATGTELARLEGHDCPVTALATLPDGRLASGGDDGIIRLWDTVSGVQMAMLQGHTRGVSMLAVLSNGHLASVCAGDNSIRLWDPIRDTELAQLSPKRGWVRGILPDGRIVSQTRDDTILLWDQATGAELARLEGHRGQISDLAMLPDGRLASGAWDSTIRLWDCSTGKELARLEGHDGAVALAVLPDGRLVSGGSGWGDDRTIRFWDTVTGAELAQLKGHDEAVHTLVIMPDGRLASGSRDKSIRLWDTGTGEIATLERHKRGVISAIAILPDGRLASGTSDNTIRIWSPATGSELARLEGGGWVTALAVLPDGRLASGANDKMVRLWDPATGAELAQLERHDGWVMALALLPDGRLASGSGDKTIRIWDIATGAELARLEGHDGTVYAIAILPDGRLASGSEDNTIRLWDSVTGAELARLEGHDGPVYAIATLPDGRLASGAEGNTIRLWDPDIGTELMRLVGHDGPVRTLAALPDGRLASGADDNTIRLWDLTTGAELARLEVDARVFRLAASPDGGLVAGDGLGRIHWLKVMGAEESSGGSVSGGTEPAFVVSPPDVRSPKPLTRTTPMPAPPFSRNKLAAESTVRQSRGGWLAVIVLAVIVAAIVAAVLPAGPALDFAQAREVWQAMLQEVQK